MNDFSQGLSVIEGALRDAVRDDQLVIDWVPPYAAGVVPPESLTLRARTERAVFSGTLSREVVEDCQERIDRPEAYSLVAAATKQLRGASHSLTS